MRSVRIPLQRSKKILPSSVMVKDRVVRWNRRNCNRSSNLATLLLTADGETPRSRLAAAKVFSALHRSLKRDLRLPRERFVLYSRWHRSLSDEEIITRGAEAYLPR